MPGRSADKMFWCIVASLILMFIKDGFIIIGIIWAGFFFIVLPREAKEQKRCEEYDDLRRHPDKYKGALLRARDICSGNIKYVTGIENDINWWNNELDPETRDYIRSTPYYDHRLFRNIKELDNIAEYDKKYIGLIKKIGKENVEAIDYALKIGKGKVGLSKNHLERWWGRDISPEARKIIRKLECYNSPYFATIQSYDKKEEEWEKNMEKWGTLPECAHPPDEANE